MVNKDYFDYYTIKNYQIISDLLLSLQNTTEKKTDYCFYQHHSQYDFHIDFFHLIAIL